MRGRPLHRARALPRCLTRHGNPRARPSQAHDARREVLAAVHGPGRPRGEPRQPDPRRLRTPAARPQDRRRPRHARRPDRTRPALRGSRQPRPALLRGQHTTRHPGHPVRRGGARTRAVRRYGVPGGHRARRELGYRARAPRGDRDRARGTHAWRAPGALPRAQPRARSAVGARRGNVRRGRAPGVSHGRGVHPALRTRGRRHHAKALHRQLWRRRP